MKLIIFGATGTAGGEVVREAIKDPEITEITAVVRRPLEIQNPKLKTVIHSDYLNYAQLSENFKNADACAWCLGISQSQVSEEEYIKITYDYALAAAKEILKTNPDMAFLFLSGEGADQEEKAKTLFGRIKGRTEKALMALYFKKFYIVRPAGIQPIHLNKNTAFFNKVAAPFFPILKLFAPSFVITSAELAVAILSILKTGPDKVLFNNSELKQLAKN